MGRDDILSHFLKRDKRRDGFHLLLKTMKGEGKSDTAIEQTVYSNNTYAVDPGEAGNLVGPINLKFIGWAKCKS